jgi:hypothetical protein
MGVVTVTTRLAAVSLARDRTGLVSKRKDSPYRSGRSPDWLKMKNPACEVVRREAEEDWGKERRARISPFASTCGARTARASLSTSPGLRISRLHKRPIEPQSSVGRGPPSRRARVLGSSRTPVERNLPCGPTRAARAGGEDGYHAKARPSAGAIMWPGPLPGFRPMA